MLPLDSWISSPNIEEAEAAAADDRSRRGSCFRRPSMQEEAKEEAEEVDTAQHSMGEDASSGDTIAPWLCSRFNISFTEKGVDVPGLGNIARNSTRRKLLTCHMDEVNNGPLLSGNIYWI